MSFKTIEEIKDFFQKDNYVKLSGIEILSADQTQACVGVDVKDCHLNANGFVQGGMLYTLADFAFAVLANTLHSPTVTQCGNVTYLKAATGKKLIATAKEKVRAGHNCVCEVTVQDENNDVVCIAHFNGFIKEKQK